MTKEIILKNSLLAIDSYNIKKNVGERWPRFNQEESTIAIYKAMDEYAKQQAIAFSEWNLKDGRIMFENRIKTTEELYTQFIDNQFIEQQNKP